MTTIELLRQFRLGEYAIFDLATAFIGMLILSPFLSWLFRKIRINVPILSWIFLTLPIGIFAHILIGKITPMTKYFIDLHGHYILKIFILGLLVLGLKGIKMINKKKKFKK